VPLSDLLDDAGELQLNPDVEAKDYFTIQLVKGKVRLQARGFIGLIPLNDRVAIDVVPRTPVRNLSRLLMVAQHAPDLLLRTRIYAHDPLWADSLLDAYAYGLLNQMEEIASQGLLREYHNRVETTSFPRGRILTGSTIRRLQIRGIQHQAVASWFERDPDNAANRCLKYSLWFLAQRLSREASAHGKRRYLLDRLAPLYAMFSDVTLDHSLSFLHDRLVRGEQRLPSLRAYYRPALDIATAIILAHGVKLDTAGDVIHLPSLILNMSLLFENYLRNVLRTHGYEQQWRHEVLDGNTDGRTLLFDDPPSEDATPDIVLRDPITSRCPLIVEVKNVPVKGMHSDRSAIEQAVTYGVSYRCNQVVLAHPRSHSGNFSGLRLQGKVGNLAIYQYVFDLSTDPLENEEARFAATIQKLATGDTARLANQLPTSLVGAEPHSVIK
jgi:5-methylcytosine-specific restriction enzyme subunit McrC